jgi:SM-20-related protein
MPSTVARHRIAWMSSSPLLRTFTATHADAPVELLAPRTDWDAMAAEFARRGHVVLAEALLPPIAEHWLQRIESWHEWALVTRIEGQHRSFDARGMAVLDLDKRIAFDELVARGARDGFQYLYERYPLYDLARTGHLADPVLTQVHALLHDPQFLALARRITGRPDIRYADGQITRYRRGHFLTLHDDRAEGMERVAAFVLNLTPRWAADFGGQLQFVDAQGQVEASVTPRFNALSLFAVPRPHLVGAVANFVDDARYALTGWFHTGEEPPLARD